MIFFPDADSKIRCRHRAGDPDCACFPECPDCGVEFDPKGGHSCDDAEDEAGEDDPFGICPGDCAE